MKFIWSFSLMLLYIILAILFWAYSLHKQNNMIYELELQKIELLKSTFAPNDYRSELLKIEDKKNRRKKQYWGEGTTNMFVIIIGSSIVYLSFYKQQQLNKLKKNFMLSVTHELKTPIAGIKLNMQTLEKRKLDTEVQEKLIKASVEETNRLNDLCTNILIATQLEDNQKAIYSDIIEINELVEETCNELMSRYKQLQINIEKSNEKWELNGDKMLWKMVFSNLLENARKYSPIDKPIHVLMLNSNRKKMVQIIDFGPGIPETEKTKVFDKFYRIGNENTRKSKGTGLGLYIVKKIINLYKYDISVKNNPEGGTIFEVLLK